MTGHRRRACALAVLGLTFAGCAPGAAPAAGGLSPPPQPAGTTLLGVADVAFPGRARVTAGDVSVGDEHARVETATYVEPAAYLPFHYHETPLLMEARVVWLDGGMATDDDTLRAFGDDLRAAFDQIGEVQQASRTIVGGAPGYAFEVDIPVNGPLRRHGQLGRRRAAAHASMRIGVGPSSVCVFLTAFWRDALTDDDFRRGEIQGFLGSARVHDPGLVHRPTRDGTPPGLAQAVARMVTEES